MEGAEVDIFEKANNEGFTGFLQRDERLGGPAGPVVLVILGDLTHEAAERQFADEQAGGFLVVSDVLQSLCSGPEALALRSGRSRRLARGSGAFCAF